MPKGKESLIITPVDDPGNPHFTIKGSTLAIKDALREGGAVWQGSQLYWLLNGSTIPQSIQDAIGEAYGMYGLPKHPSAPRKLTIPVTENVRKQLEAQGIIKPEPTTTKEKVQSGRWNEVYATEDIQVNGKTIVPVGTKGKVQAGGESSLHIVFDNGKHVILDKWNMVTTDAPKQQYPIRQYDEIKANSQTGYEATHSATYFHEDGKVELGAGFFNDKGLFVSTRPWSMFTREQWESGQAKNTETVEGGICADCKVLTRKLLFFREGKTRCAECDAKFVEGDLLQQPAAVADEPEIMTTVLGPKPPTEETVIVHMLSTDGDVTEHEVPLAHFIEKDKAEAQTFKVGQPVRHKVLKCTGIISSLFGNESAMVNVADHTGQSAVYHASQYRLIDLEPHDVRLPIRQVEMLTAIRDKQPVKKNAATRMALRRYGMITNTNDWDKIELTPAGSGWLENFGQVLEQVKSTPALKVEVDYSIEARYGVEQGDDWMKWNVCHICGVCLDGDGHIHQIGLGDICDTCLGEEIPPVAKRDKPLEAPKQPEPAPVAKSRKKAVKTPSEAVPEIPKPLAWERREIVAQLREGSRRIEADVYGQVGIHAQLVHSNKVQETHLSLTHLLSGRTVVTGFYRMPILRELAEQLASVDIDQWWKDVQIGDVKAKAGNDAIVEIVLAWKRDHNLNVDADDGDSPIGETVDDVKVAAALDELAEAVAL